MSGNTYLHLKREGYGLQTFRAQAGVIMVLPVVFAFAYHAYILNSETSTLIHSYNNEQLRRGCQLDSFYTFL